MPEVEVFFVYANKVTRKVHRYVRGRGCRQAEIVPKRLARFVGETLKKALREATKEGYVPCKHCWHQR